MVDHKKIGKKLDFPRCAIDALAHIGSYSILYAERIGRGQVRYV